MSDYKNISVYPETHKRIDEAHKKLKARGHRINKAQLLDEASKLLERQVDSSKKWGTK